MTTIQLKNVNIKFEKTDVIKNLSIKFTAMHNSVLLGLSGSGKTTILKAIAGIGKVDEGKVLFDTRDVTNTPPHERNIGYIPQKQLLFPGLSVFENIAYGLQSRKITKKEIKIRVQEIAKILGITHLLTRTIANLSGGEAQKVALARALAPKPKVLLFDEPFSALDTGERMKMILQLKETLENLPITTVYVTHSPQEAEIIADEIFILEAGKIIQQGSFLKVQQNPKSLHVAKLLGLPNIFSELPTKFMKVKGIERYKKNGYYHIPPQKFVQNIMGNITGKILAHYGTKTVVKIAEIQVVIQRIDAKVGTNVRLELTIN